MPTSSTECLLEAAFTQRTLAMPVAAAGLLARYWELLQEWASAVNLTGCRTAAEFVDVLVLEALAPIALGLTAPPDGSIFDVGSGSGSPGIVLAVAWPERQVLLVEANERKAAFLRHVAGTLPLANVTVLHARAEAVGQDRRWREAVALVVSRAAAKPPRACELCLPLVRVGGQVWLYLSGVDGDVVGAQAAALAPLGVGVVEMHPTGARKQCVAVLHKIGSTDAVHPRPERQAKRRPIF